MGWINARIISDFRVSELENREVDSGYARDGTGHVDWPIIVFPVSLESAFSSRAIPVALERYIDHVLAPLRSNRRFPQFFLQ